MIRQVLGKHFLKFLFYIVLITHSVIHFRVLSLKTGQETITVKYGSHPYFRVFLCRFLIRIEAHQFFIRYMKSYSKSLNCQHNYINMQTEVLEYIRILTANTNTVRLHFPITKLPPLGIPSPRLHSPNHSAWHFHFFKRSTSSSPDRHCPTLEPSTVRQFYTLTPHAPLQPSAPRLSWGFTVPYVFFTTPSEAPVTQRINWLKTHWLREQIGRGDDDAVCYPSWLVYISYTSTMTHARSSHWLPQEWCDTMDGITALTRNSLDFSFFFFLKRFVSSPLHCCNIKQISRAFFHLQ